MAAIIFILFNILAIQLPGFVLYRLLIKKEYGPELALLASYFLGMMLLFVEYLIETEAGIPYFTVIASVTFILIFVLRRKDWDKNSIKIDKITWILFAAVFVFSFVNYTFPYMMAKSATSVQVYHDILFHTGNVTSLSRGMFSDDLRVYGLTFYYHFFYDLIYGICKHMTGVNSFDLLMAGTPFISAWWMALALTIFGKRLDIDNKDISKVLTYGAPLFAGLLMYPFLIKGFHFPLSGVTEQVTDNCNALGMGVAIGVVIIEFFADWWKEKIDARQMLAMALLMMALTGAKGPVAAVLLATITVVAIVESIIDKHIYIYQKITIAISAAGFVLIYKLIDTGIGVTEQNANRSMALTPLGTLVTTRVTQMLEYLGFGMDDYSHGILLVIAEILLTCTILGPCLFGFIGYVVMCTKKLIKKKRVDNLYDWIAIGGSIIGLGGVLFIDIPGFSQQYCLIGVSPLYAYCVVKYIENGHVKGLVKLTKAMLVLGMICFVLDIAHNAYEGHLQNKINNYPYEDDVYCISNLELQGLEWIRENTPKDSLVAYDRYSEEIDYRSCFFYCSAFSERQVYLEGWSYSNVSDETALERLEINELFYDADEDIALAALKDEEIDYLVVSRMAHKNYKAPDGFKCEFANNDIAVYSFDN